MTNLIINPKNLLVAGFNFLHHSNSSGYHHIAEYLPCTYLNANKFPFGKCKFGTKGRQVNLWLFELYLKYQSPKYKIVHYLYPENHLTFSVPFNKDTISVATFHLSLEWFKEIDNSTFFLKKKVREIRKNNLMNLNGVITLTKDQESELKKILPSNILVKFIPHGINELPVNLESVEKKETLNIVVIGSNYRDENQFFEVAKYSKTTNKNWKFHLIGVPSNWKLKARNYENIIVYPYLEEDEYFDVLQKSHVHFLPVSFATANNALLESHVFGLPTIATNIQGIQDYSLTTTYTFSSIEEAIFQLESIHSMDESEYLRLRRKTKQESERFLWPNIAKEIINFYNELYLVKNIAK